MKVDTRHADYTAHAPKWKRCRDVSDGQDAVHKAGVNYLPKLTAQSDPDYQSYKLRASFYNATWRTLAGLIGMLYRKPPQVELPGAIEPLADDIDLAGTSLLTFSRNIALEVLEVGRVGIMVDYPPPDIVPLNKSAAEAMGLRPMLKAYKAENIINWRYARRNNRWVLVMVVLEEVVSEPEDEFADKSVMQWRVLDLEGSYRQRVFRKRAVASEGMEFEQIGPDFYPTMSGKVMVYIPFAIVGPDGLETELDEPPLIDLVDLNLAHYRVTADYEHGCHFTGLPTLFLSGIDRDAEGNAPSFYIGSQAAIVASDPNAKGMFIEFTGQGMGALQKNLERKEEQMAILGARMLFAEKRQAEAAETASIHRTGENSVLASIALGISEALEWALEMFAAWAGAPGDVVYQLNRDFNPAMIDSQQMMALLKGVQAGQLSEQEFFSLMQRGDIIDSGVTFEEHQEQVASTELPALPVEVAA